MVVMVLQKTPVGLKGDLTHWLMEVREGVYVGHVSALVRDLLWERCCKSRGAGRVFQAWSTNNEQHFQMRLAGCNDARVVDWEGVFLIQESRDDLTKVQKRRVKQ